MTHRTAASDTSVKTEQGQAQAAWDLASGFIDGLASGKPWDPDPAVCLNQAVAVDRALRLLLAEHRDWLEANGRLGCLLPRLAHAAPALEEAALENGSPRGECARIMLALLPFPGSLRRLAALEARDPGHALVRLVRDREKAKLGAKVLAKGADAYKTHNLCQVVKAHRNPEEKGVVRMHTLVYALPGQVLRELSERYVFFVEPPMGGCFRHLWLRRFSTLKDPALVGAPGNEDMGWLATQPGLSPLPLSHGHFLADKPPEPDAAKAWDIVFNSAYNDLPRKRHGLMLDLLNTPELATATALFLGYGAPEHVDGFKGMVAKAGLKGRVRVEANLPRRKVPRLLAACRMGVHLSQLENSPRAVPEFFRQNLPCVMSRLTVGMDFTMFTRATGAAVPDRDLAGTIRRVLDNPERYHPRRWWLRYSGSPNCSRMLNEYLKKHFKELGYAWTSDICAITGSGAHRYADRAMLERFAADYAWIRERLRAANLPFTVR